MTQYDIKEKITTYIDALSCIGANDEGGITRLLYTPEWKATQEEVLTIMKGIGMEADYDEVGNLFGRFEGEMVPEETILIGSHIDTVKNGGKYDGQFGIVAGIIAAEYLKQTEGSPRRSIEVVSIAEEEGSRFPYTFWGVKNILGLAARGDVQDIEDSQGTKFVDAMRAAGFDFSQKGKKLRKDIRQFIEIHIEQGSVLEKEGKSIGVVTAIVGQRRYNVEVTGQSNHAGSTPMSYRKDAVYVTSKMISKIIDAAKSYGDPLVATVGNIEVSPNIVNVIAGKVKFTIDIRHTDQNTLCKFTELVENELAKLAKEHAVQLNVEMYMDEKPVQMCKELVSSIKNICKERELKYKVMHSGAGHDSQLMAQYVPTAMLFVPSVDGISHNPLEYTSLEDLAVGVEALIHILKKLAY
ncbi:allantoate deiminase [Wukongibacter baidiensis]|uniref:allantoate deiminase n=1 Tax=Wukongibacter baidiensis TaxID=1723361 RepID=UPI003D7FD09B